MNSPSANEPSPRRRRPPRAPVFSRASHTISLLWSAPAIEQPLSRARRQDATFAAADVEQPVVRLQRERLEHRLQEERVCVVGTVGNPRLPAARPPRGGVGHPVDPPFAEALDGVHAADVARIPGVSQNNICGGRSEWDEGEEGSLRAGAAAPSGCRGAEELGATASTSWGPGNFVPLPLPPSSTRRCSWCSTARWRHPGDVERGERLVRRGDLPGRPGGRARLPQRDLYAGTWWPRPGRAPEVGGVSRSSAIAPRPGPCTLADG